MTHDKARGRPNQYDLLRQRRFLPFFLVHILGAINENLLKNALLFLVTYQSAAGAQMSPRLVALAGGLYILPFVLFSGIAGGMAQRHDKTSILKYVKAFEVGIMVLAAVALEDHDIALLLATLFLMGSHSTFFAPAGYGLLPQVLRSDELVGGNGLLKTGTVLAILLGTSAGGLAAARSPTLIGVGLLSSAAVGFVICLAIPSARAVAPGRRIGWNPLTSSLESFRAARESRTVLLSVLGVSWFWFYGALVFEQLPLYCQNILHGNGSVVTLAVAVFALGVSCGSLLCERLSGGQIELGLVPFGSFGLTLFALDWVWAAPHVAPGRVIDLPGLMVMPGGWRVLFDIAAIGACAGLFVVPLNALVQQRSSPVSLPRIIGANSMLNVLFMVAASVLGAAGTARGMAVTGLLAGAAILNAAVALYIYRLVPEFLLRFVCYVLVHVLYRMRRTSGATFPETGAALLVSNHVTFVDALVISAACRRPVHFIMDEAIFNAPIIRTLARAMKAIPIASARDDAAVLERAFHMTAQALRDGDLVCIFPEGRLTRDGLIGTFRAGLMRILSETPVPVIPLAIVGLWGSMFSKQTPRVWQRLPRKLGARIAVNVGAAVDPRTVSPQGLRAQVQAQYDRGA